MRREEGERGMLRTELKKIMFSPQYAGCILVLFTLLMIGTLGFWSTYVGNETISMLAHFIDGWVVFGNVYMVLPLMAAVPITFLLHDELNSGYVNFSLVRAGKRKYMAVKMTAGILSGFFMVVLANLIFTVVLIILTPGRINFFDQQNVLGKEPCFYYNLAKSGQGYIVYSIWTVLTGLYGSVCSALAVVASTVAKNKYVAVVIPFVVFICHENFGGYLFFLPGIFHRRLEAIFFPFYHLEWLSGIPKSLSIVLLWILVSTVLYYIFMRRRLRG